MRGDLGNTAATGIILGNTGLNQIKNIETFSRFVYLHL